jgi:hypothetical protein
VWLLLTPRTAARRRHRAGGGDYAETQRVMWHVGTIGERPVPAKASLALRWTAVPDGDMFVPDGHAAM